MSTPISFTAKVGKTSKTIPLEQITHFEHDSKYVTAYYPGGELLLTTTIAHLEMHLAATFIRCHRAVLVARNRIVDIQPCRLPTGHAESNHIVVLQGTDMTPPVSRRLAPAIRRVLREMQPCATDTQASATAATDLCQPAQDTSSAMPGAGGHNTSSAAYSPERSA